MPVTPTTTDHEDEVTSPNKKARRDAAQRAAGSIAAQTAQLSGAVDYDDDIVEIVGREGGGQRSPRVKEEFAQRAPLPAPVHEPGSVRSTQSFRDGPALPTSRYRESEPFKAQFYPPGYNLKQAEQRRRVFDIEHVPVLHPTSEQFDDPLSYIESISEIGRRYGAVKIVPPRGWTPSCAIDPNVRRTAVMCRILSY